MAELKIFTPQDLAERNKPKRQQQREAKEHQIQHYADMVSGARQGSGGEITLAQGENKKKIRDLLKEAGKRANLQLRFRPIKDPLRIEFTVEEPPAKRRGRKKKSA